MTQTTLAATIMIAVGLVGIVLPILPGLVLVWGGVAVWAFGRQDVVGWVTLGIATAIVAAGTVVKYAIPGRRLREGGVPWLTLAAGAALGVVGFFVIPVVGMVVGFVLGVYLAELGRLRTHNAAWPSTKRALAAVGWSILIELVTGMIVAVGWGVTAALA